MHRFFDTIDTSVVNSHSPPSLMLPKYFGHQFWSHYKIKHFTPKKFILRHASLLRHRFKVHITQQTNEINKKKVKRNFLLSVIRYVHISTQINNNLKQRQCMHTYLQMRTIPTELIQAYLVPNRSQKIRNVHFFSGIKTQVLTMLLQINEHLFCPLLWWASPQGLRYVFLHKCTVLLEASNQTDG